MSLFLWMVTGTGFLASLCTVHEWRLGNVPTPLQSTVYTTFSKVALAAFLAWVTVACMTGHSGTCVKLHTMHKCSDKSCREHQEISWLNIKITFELVC